MAPKDSGKNKFANIEEATKYFMDIYEGLPEMVIQEAIEFCMRNPEKMPDKHEEIDLRKVPRPKKEKEVIIEGAVEIIENPEDPSLKVLKHREGATILTAEEADELQIKIDEAIANQKQEELDEYYEKYDEVNKKMLKNKLRAKLQDKRHGR